MYYLFTDSTLLTVIFGCFMAGFLPILIMVARCPEARTFIKAQMGGGIVVRNVQDEGVIEYIIAKPFGAEGQYISGKNQFGMRRIFVKPRIESGLLNRPFILKGIRRPEFDHYSGKTVVVPPSVSAAIAVAEAKKSALPDLVKKWAKENQISLKEEGTGWTEQEHDVSVPEDEANPDGPKKTIKQKIKVAKRYIHYTTTTLFNTDPTMLKQYFSEFFDMGQFDVLLERENQEGYGRGLGMRKAGGKGGVNKWFLIGIVIFVMIAVVGIVLLGMGGGLKL